MTAITDDNIIGFYANFMSGETEQDKVKSYLWGVNGLKETLKPLKWQNYGQDFHLILFQVYVKPIPSLRNALREIESYRRKEKSIGIPIIIDQENFFNLNEKDRLKFFQTTIQVKLDLVKEKVKRNKLDLDIDKLKLNVDRLLNVN
jgi:hypothetical protein